MAKKQSLEKKKALKAQSIEKRTQREKEESAILSRCLGMLAVLTVAEIYFLLCYRFFVQGTVQSLVTMASVIGVLSWVGLAAAVVGVILAVVRRGKPYGHGSAWLALFGAVLFVGGRMMLTFFSTGTTLMCVMVPLLALAGFVYYLYQREFFLSGLGLGIAVFGMWFVRRAVGSATWGSRYMIVEIVLLVLVLALLAVTVVIGRNGGNWGKGTHAVKIFSGTTNYAVAYAALALAAIGLLAGALVPSLALYLLWGGVALLFVLAVYYTIHLM